MTKQKIYSTIALFGYMAYIIVGAEILRGGIDLDFTDVDMEEWGALLGTSIELFFMFFLVLIGYSYSIFGLSLFIYKAYVILYNKNNLSFGCLKLDVLLIFLNLVFIIFGIQVSYRIFVFIIFAAVSVVCFALNGLCVLKDLKETSFQPLKDLKPLF